MSNKNWLLCPMCENWQPVGGSQSFVDWDGCTWQACEFCGEKEGQGPTIIQVDGNTYTTEEMTKEENTENE